MKKKIALLIGVLILLTAVFAACTKTPTAKQLRWETEHLEYNITLADFAAEGKNLFNTHPYNGSDYYKDTAINSQESINLGNADEIRPVAASGKYVMDIKDVADNYSLTTDQVLYVQYETEKLKNLNCLETLKDYIISATDANNPFDNNDGRTTLKSVTKSEVIFNKTENQTPVSSKIENDGFYVGSLKQCVSKYKYETTYNFKDRKVTVKVNGGNEETRKLDIRKNTVCIDSLQLLLYIRSLDKSSNAFQDSPAVTVYDPVSDKVATASFALNREFNAVVVNGTEDVYTKLNAVSAAVGGTPFLTQFNLPDLTGVSDGGLDWRSEGASGKLCKFTTVKFRAGVYSYEIASYEDKLVSALKDLVK